MRTPLFAMTALLAAGAAPAAFAEGGGPQGLAAAVGPTVVTSRSHQLQPGADIYSAEGAACASGQTMLSGSCHPGFTDGVRIINQFPNTWLNAWRCGFANNTAQTRTVWVYTLCAGDAAPPGPPLVTHDLSVRRFTTTPLTNADADRIMGDADTVAQVSDTSDDVACNIRVRRSGDVGVLNVGDGSLDSSAEFNAVITAPGWIKAVNQINWCGSIGANIIGCAPVPGTSLTVVRFTESLEGILWLHEFGHNKGLSHRNGTNNVMHPSIGSTRRGVNQSECDAFRVASLLGVAAGPPQAEGTQVAAGPRVMPASETDATPPSAGEEPPEDVREFVRQVFVHGVPFELASQYGPEDIPPLEALLRDPSEPAIFRANAAATIGMIGEEDSASVLIAFIEEEAPQETAPDSYRVVSTAVLSLGYVANLAESEQALNYLIERLDPGAWEGSEVPRAAFQASEIERDVDLSKHALLGLALSGREEAREAIQAMQAPSRGEAVFESQVGSLAEEALRENEAVAEKGLEGYYADREP